MLNIERIKELLNNKNISDQEAKEIRDDFRSLAEIVFEQWQLKNREKSVVNFNRKVHHISLQKCTTICKKNNLI
jgi:hypothetical protein